MRPAARCFVIVCFILQPNYDTASAYQFSNSDELRPISLLTNVSVELGAYQVALEEVLTWLLEAEDKLAQHEHIPENLETLKNLFHAHEVCFTTFTRASLNVDYRISIFTKHKITEIPDGTVWPSRRSWRRLGRGRAFTFRRRTDYRRV